MAIAEEIDLAAVDGSVEAGFAIKADIAPRVSFATHQADIPVAA